MGLDRTDAVIRVGEGRGFIIAADGRPYVITAAHCLPALPPAHAMSYQEERTFRDLLGPIGGKATVWAECVFVDPVADVAVLAQPDNQQLFNEAEAYDELIDPVVPFRIGALEFAREQHRLLNGEAFFGPPTPRRGERC